MDLYMVVIGVSERQIEGLVRFYQGQQIVPCNEGVQNHMDVSFMYIGDECVLTASNPHKTYPTTLAQRGLWVKGLAGFLRNILGKDKVYYNESYC